MAKGDRHWTVAQRNLAVDLVKQGKTYREVETETGIPNCTVSRIMGRYKKNGTTASLEGRGTKRKTNTSIDRNIVIKIKKNRFQSARNFAKKVANEHVIKITPQTIRNRIKEAGFQGRHVRKKPYLTKNHMKRRT